MAIKVTYICDKCSHEETQESIWDLENNGWKEVKLEISQYNKKKYLFCPACMKALGLLKENSNFEKPVETVADRLLACIAEIVAEKISEMSN